MFSALCMWSIYMYLYTHPRMDKISVTLWDTSGEEDINVNETIAKVLKAEDLQPRLPAVGGDHIDKATL